MYPSLGVYDGTRTELPCMCGASYRFQSGNGRAKNTFGKYINLNSKFEILHTLSVNEKKIADRFEMKSIK